MNEDKNPETAELTETAGEEHSLTIAKLRLNPMMRHATTANAMAAATVKFDGATVSPVESTAALTSMAEQVKGGDLGPVSDFMLAQAVMLDSTVTEMMRRAWLNAGDYPDAFRSYMGLALKAQAQSRASLEALARMHQPREQVVRHVHVYEGGQAVVAEQLHMHGPGVRNAENDDQSQAARAAGTGECAALPCPDPLGNGVPIPGGSRAEAVQDARRDEPRGSTRKSAGAKTRSADG